jgi:hypothetical protein
MIGTNPGGVNKRKYECLCSLTLINFRVRIEGQVVESDLQLVVRLQPTPAKSSVVF